MRSVLTEISSKLFWLSILFFILGLLIPLLRGPLSPEEKGGNMVQEPPGTLQKTNESPEPEHTQSPATDDGLQPSITLLQSEAGKNQSNELPADNQTADTPALAAPIAATESANDRSPGELSASQSLEPSISEVVQNQSKGLKASTQAVGASGLSSGDMPNAPPIEPNQGESTATQTLQTPPEPTTAKLEEKSPRSVNSSVAEKKRPSQQKPARLLVLGGGLFPVGEGTPRADLEEAIDNIIPLINARSPDKVVVEGHADKWVPDGYSPAQVSKFNKIVSLQRANAIAKLLEQKGVARDRIIVKGLGDAVPLASNRTNAGRAKNRRVEIKLMPAR